MMIFQLDIKLMAIAIFKMKERKHLVWYENEYLKVST